MAALTLSASRRRNVKPTTSVLHVFVEDVDCTDATFNSTPEDGQFVVVQGKTAIHSSTAGATDKFHDGTDTNIQDVNGPNLRMVWGSAQRSDRSALGQQRVPVFKKGAVRVKTKLFNVANDGTTLAGNGYVAGALLSVGNALSAVEGAAAADRLCLEPMANSDFGWAVGYVERVVTDSVVAGRGEIEVYLYDSPKYVSQRA